MGRLKCFGTKLTFSSDTVPDSQKSTSQAMHDKVSRETEHHDGHESTMDKIKHAFTGDKHHSAHQEHTHSHTASTTAPHDLHTEVVHTDVKK